MSYDMTNAYEDVMDICVRAEKALLAGDVPKALKILETRHKIDKNVDEMP